MKGMPAGIAQSVGADLDRCSMKPTSDIARAIDEGCHAQSVERDSKRTGVDRGRGFKDFFGSVDLRRLLTLVAQRIADGRVIAPDSGDAQAGSYGKGRLFPSERGTPQGSVVSPLLSNILLTPFDQEMRRKGYQLTRFATIG